MGRAWTLQTALVENVHLAASDELMEDVITLLGREQLTNHLPLKLSP